jgi:hypothetical protein
MFHPASARCGKASRGVRCAFSRGRRGEQRRAVQEHRRRGIVLEDDVCASRLAGTLIGERVLGPSLGEPIRLDLHAARVYASLDGDLLGRYGFGRLSTLPEATPWESVRKRS